MLIYNARAKSRLFDLLTYYMISRKLVTVRMFSTRNFTEYTLTQQVNSSFLKPLNSSRFVAGVFIN